LIEDNRYALTAFWYTHFNPVEAGLVLRMEDREFTSYLDFCYARNTSLCKVALAKELIALSDIDFLNSTISSLQDMDLDQIF
jgi:hypothetical protein